MRSFTAFRMTDCLITVILSLLAENPPEGWFAVE